LKSRKKSLSSVGKRDFKRATAVGTGSRSAESVQIARWLRATTGIGRGRLRCNRSTLRSARITTEAARNAPNPESAAGSSTGGSRSPNDSKSSASTATQRSRKQRSPRSLTARWIDDRESVIFHGELPDGAGELVLQVVSDPNAHGSLIVTTNLPFGEWTKVFPDPRLAEAVVDRITHKAHIIDTGTESWRFRHGLERQRRTRT
jgi:IstB-like ATP binding protein